MRQAGTLSNRERAERLADYLLTQGISARVDADGDRWAIWIHDEDRLPQAIEELREFRANPGAEKYRSAAQAAESLRKQQARDDGRRLKNIVQLRDRWQTRHAGSRPLTMLLIAASIFVTLSTQFGEDYNRVMQTVMFQSLQDDGQGGLGWPGPIHDIEHGQIWRLVTPIFIHFFIWHLLFNMFWLYDLGSAIETRRGTLRFALLVLATAVLSNYAEYFFSYELEWTKEQGIRIGGGMSGVVYGLFGYVWMKSRYDPLAGLRVSNQTIVLMLAWLVICWTGVIGPVGNWAHLVGLIFGMAIGYAPIAWRNIANRK